MKIWCLLFQEKQTKEETDSVGMQAKEVAFRRCPGAVGVAAVWQRADGGHAGALLPQAKEEADSVEMQAKEVAAVPVAVEMQTKKVAGQDSVETPAKVAVAAVAVQATAVASERRRRILGQSLS